jgi:iron(III) transport system permease protein
LSVVDQPGRVPVMRRVRPARRIGRPGWVLAPIVVALLAIGPVAMLATSVLRPNTDMWRQQWRTRLPDQIIATLVLTIGVVVCSVVVGVGLAWLVAAHRFPGRRLLSWALVLPLAMPSYILGFVTTAVFGVAGPVQIWWRDQFGRDAWFPEVQTMPGAVLTLTLTLYPYVYLLARTALRDQAGTAALVARTLGASRAETTRRVVVPMLRPAIGAGAAIVAMETLTDFATVQYFKVETVTVGVFRIWRGTYDRDAASEIATLVLAFALLVIGLERVLRGGARFGESAGQAVRVEPARLTGWRAFAATLGAASIVAVGFVAPTVRLVTWAIAEQRGPRGTPMLSRYADFLGHSLTLTLTTVFVCVLASTIVANAGRFSPTRVVGVANRVSVVGYAVPGPVVAMGVVLILVALDDALHVGGIGLPGFAATGSFIALAYAYSVRFLAPGMTTLESGITQIPVEVTASAQSLGARPSSVLRRIHLPLARTSLLTAAIMVGVDALKELPIAYLLRPVGFDTLPVWVYDLASESRFEQAALPALTIIAVALIPVAILSRHLDQPASARAAS